MDDSDQSERYWLVSIRRRPARLGLAGLITDVEVDWADATLGSIYVTFGGLGDRRRVWHFDGTKWTVRSGAPGSDLLDVEHNALAVDPTAPANIYVGAGIGVWHSADAGKTWEPLQNGLPDAPVVRHLLETPPEILALDVVQPWRDLNPFSTFAPSSGQLTLRN